MPHLDPDHPLAKLLKTDKRYKFDAYIFVFEALEYAHNVLGLGQAHAREEDEEEPPLPPTKGKSKGKGKAARHLTGQQLCEAIRLYALDQYGMLAKPVLASWGVKSTADFGNIVFNLIEAGQMRKTKQDRIDDFIDVFDFEEAFIRGFKITAPTVQTE